MANPWFRFYGGEFLNDEKIVSLDGNERSIWLTVLCFASQKEGVIRFMSERRIIELSGVKNWKRYEGILNKFKDYGMLELSNGDVTVSNWAKRQYSDSYSRVKAYREKQKSNDNVTPYTDTESESESESDTDKIPFIEFWNPYPKKVEKKKAEEKWDRLPRGTQEKILKDLPLRKQTESWVKGYVLNPMTYLNGERWNDELKGLPAAPPPRKCKDCGRDAGKGWVNSRGGVCTDCFANPPNQNGRKAYEERVGTAIKTMP